MNRDSYNRKSLSLLQKIMLTIATGFTVFILCGIYVIDAFTWQQLYDFVGLTAPSQGQIENSVPLVEDSGTDNNVPAFNPYTEKARVSFLSVGQSDCTIIHSGDKIAMIDAGDMGAASIIIEYLKDNAIEKIDYLFITHPHADHIGSVSAIADSFDIGLCIMPHFSEDITPSGYTYVNMLKKLIEKGVETRLAGDDERFDMQNGAITVLSAGGFDNLNDCSLVLRFECENATFLLMGDAGKTVEKWLISNTESLKCDVLKAGHHGSKYSSSAQFITTVAPEFSVISCGEDNQYGYPTQEVLDIMQANDAKVLTTMYENVEISVNTDGLTILSKNEVTP